MKKIIKYLIVIFWLSLIFYFSNQQASDSDNVSDGVMGKVINIVENIINYEFNETEKNNIYEYGIGPLRKCAHFSIYFILGVLLYNLVSDYNLNLKKTFIISLLFCLLYACSDEIHQLFVFGRSGNVKDVCIDTLGSLLGIITISKISHRKSIKIN